MLASDFQRRIKNLNPKLRIFCGDRADTPAGLYIVEGGEYVELCGVDKNYINEWPSYNRQGKMIRGGWRRVLFLLVTKKLIDRRQSYRQFGYWTEHREPAYVTELSGIDKAISQMTAAPVTYKTIISPLTGKPVDVPVYRSHDVYDIGQMVKNESRLAHAETQDGLNLGA